MSLTLILTRHAKSSWHDETLDDYDRPLNGRGRASASALGDWLAERELVPEEVLVSGARRTVETWTGVVRGLPRAAQMRSAPPLYHADASTILSVLKGAGAPIVMLIGHNPGIGDAARRLARNAPDHLRFEDYPTGATTIFQFPAQTWTEVAWDSGEVLDFVVPRELL